MVQRLAETVIAMALQPDHIVTMLVGFMLCACSFALWRMHVTQKKNFKALECRQQNLTDQLNQSKQFPRNRIAQEVEGQVKRLGSRADLVWLQDKLPALQAMLGTGSRRAISYSRFDEEIEELRRSLERKWMGNLAAESAWRNTKIFEVEQRIEGLVQQVQATVGNGKQHTSEDRDLVAQMHSVKASLSQAHQHIGALQQQSEGNDVTAEIRPMKAALAQADQNINTLQQQSARTDTIAEMQSFKLELAKANQHICVVQQQSESNDMTRQMNTMKADLAKALQDVSALQQEKIKKDVEISRAARDATEARAIIDSAVCQSIFAFSIEDFSALREIVPVLPKAKGAVDVRKLVWYMEAMEALFAVGHDLIALSNGKNHIAKAVDSYYDLSTKMGDHEKRLNGLRSCQCCSTTEAAGKIIHTDGTTQTEAPQEREPTPLPRSRSSTTTLTHSPLSADIDARRNNKESGPEPSEYARDPKAEAYDIQTKSTQANASEDSPQAMHSEYGFDQAPGLEVTESPVKLALDTPKVTEHPEAVAQNRIEISEVPSSPKVSSSDVAGAVESTEHGVEMAGSATKMVSDIRDAAKQSEEVLYEQTDILGMTATLAGVSLSVGSVTIDVASMDTIVEDAISSSAVGSIPGVATQDPGATDHDTYNGHNIAPTAHDEDMHDKLVPDPGLEAALDLVLERLGYSSNTFIDTEMVDNNGLVPGYMNNLGVATTEFEAVDRPPMPGFGAQTFNHFAPPVFGNLGTAPMLSGQQESTMLDVWTESSVEPYSASTTVVANEVHRLVEDSTEDMNFFNWVREEMVAEADGERRNGWDPPMSTKAPTILNGNPSQSEESGVSSERVPSQPDSPRMSSSQLPLYEYSSNDNSMSPHPFPLATVIHPPGRPNSAIMKSSVPTPKTEEFKGLYNEASAKGRFDDSTSSPSPWSRRGIQEFRSVSVFIPENSPTDLPPGLPGSYSEIFLPKSPDLHFESQGTQSYAASPLMYTFNSQHDTTRYNPRLSDPTALQPSQPSSQLSNRDGTQVPLNLGAGVTRPLIQAPDVFQQIPMINMPSTLFDVAESQILGASPLSDLSTTQAVAPAFPNTANADKVKDGSTTKSLLETASGTSVTPSASSSARAITEEEIETDDLDELIIAAFGLDNPAEEEFPLSQTPAQSVRTETTNMSRIIKKPMSQKERRESRERKQQAEALKRHEAEESEESDADDLPPSTRPLTNFKTNPYGPNPAVAR